MSILDLNIQTQPQTPAANGKPERKPSDFWLNVGVTLPGAGKDADGNPIDLFVNLPNGIPLDDMKPAKVTGSVEYQHLQQTKNAILEQLQKAAAAMAPGERIRVPLLTVELYRRKEDAPVQGNPEENPLLAQLFGMGFSSK